MRTRSGHCRTRLSEQKCQACSGRPSVPGHLPKPSCRSPLCVSQESDLPAERKSGGAFPVPAVRGGTSGFCMKIVRYALEFLSYGLGVKVEDYHSQEAQEGSLLSTSPCLCAALQVSTLQDAVASQAMTALANLVSPISHCAMKEPRAPTCGSRHML